MSKARNDVGKRIPAMTQQCRDAISVKHRKWKKKSTNIVKLKSILMHINLQKSTIVALKTGGDTQLRVITKEPIS